MKLIGKFLILCCAALVNSEKINSTIENEPSKFRLATGAREAYNGEFPYQVSIQLNGIHECGGSLISPKHVLTAGHCVMDIVRNPVPAKRALKIEVGSTEIGRGQKYNAIRVSHHPDYHGEDDTIFLPYDIAVITLEHPVKLSKNVKTVNLPAEYSEPRLGTKLHISGFGTYTAGGPISPVLLKDVMTPVTLRECDSYYQRILRQQITKSHLCAKSTPDHGTCHGDSGGPLVEKKGNRIEVVGVVSGGDGKCGYGNPDIYTKVSHFISYIKSEMNNHNSPSSSNAINMHDVEEPPFGLPNNDYYSDYSQVPPGHHPDYPEIPLGHYPDYPYPPFDDDY